MAAPAGSTPSCLRVLYVTHHLPFPPVSGGRRREYELLRRLGRFDRIHVVAVSKTPEQDRRNAERLLEHCSSVEVFRAAGGSAPEAVGGGSPVGSDAPQVARHCCPAAAKRIAELLRSEEFDIVHVEGFYLWPCLARVRASSRPPVLLVEHNIEHSLWSQRACKTDGSERSRLEAAAVATRQEELRAWAEADLCAAVTPGDRAAISAATGRRVFLVADGFDHLAATGPVAATSHEGPPQAVMVGNFAYEPNADGARWCLEQIHPRVRDRVPDAELALVGSSPPEDLREAARLAPGVKLHADVESVVPHLDAAQVSLCPLRVGGGVKVKAIESLARGKAVVSTAVGIQGLEKARGKAVLVHDDADGFAAAVAELMEDRERRTGLERAAFRFARTELPRWDDCAAALRRAYLDLAGSRAARRRFGETPEPVAG
ncbi:MAG: glycosyl transferase group 1 [Solirubrobacterales bacterium]|nr:glycosyl transferase group 1 [Solirubrobacterales bacterium]